MPKVRKQTGSPATAAISCLLETCRRTRGGSATAAHYTLGLHVCDATAAVNVIALSGNNMTRHQHDVLATQSCICLRMCVNCRRILGIDATAAQMMGSLAMLLRRIRLQPVTMRVMNFEWRSTAAFLQVLVHIHVCCVQAHSGHRRHSCSDDGLPGHGAASYGG
jgi:hypothetical protein